MENGQLKDVLFVDRLKTKTTINLLSEKVSHYWLSLDAS